MKAMRRTISIVIFLLLTGSLAILGISTLLENLLEEEAPIYDTATGATEVWIGDDEQNYILVHCGNSMRPAAEVLGRQFQELHGIGVKFNFGGSSQLLPAIELARTGDVYICHDPYADILDAKGLLEYYETVGYLEPVIIVPRGNPHQIDSLQDLKQSGLRVGLTDQRYTTAGELIQAAMAERGWQDEINANVRMESRDHNTLALAIMADQLDVAVAWNFVTYLYSGRVERINTGESFPDTRVTACLLSHASNQEAAQLFMDFLVSDASAEVFARFGYTKAAW